jgi:hypothetical protein
MPAFPIRSIVFVLALDVLSSAGGDTLDLLSGGDGGALGRICSPVVLVLRVLLRSFRRVHGRLLGFLGVGLRRRRVNSVFHCLGRVSDRVVDGFHANIGCGAVIDYRN